MVRRCQTGEYIQFLPLKGITLANGMAAGCIVKKGKAVAITRDWQHISITIKHGKMKLLKLSLFFVGLCVLFSDVNAYEIKPIALDNRKQLVNLPGMCSTQPGKMWEQGIVTGNGVMGASVLGQPYKEKVIFNHESLFRPLFDERPQTPNISGALPNVRKLIKDGQTQKALEIWQVEMKNNDHPEIVNTPCYHPAYTMSIERKNVGDITNYLRMVDFFTGEATVLHTNSEGKWINKTFVSREDNIIVQLFRLESGKPFNISFQLEDQWHGLSEEMAKINTETSDQWMIARCKYNYTKRGYEGATRIVNLEGEVKHSGNKVQCENVKQILLITRITDLDDFEQSEILNIQRELNNLPANYNQLLNRHTKLHRTAMERMAIRLDLSDDRYLSSEELIKKQSESIEIIPAFLEKMFNMGRYALLSSSGNYPPPLTGIWNGLHKPAWSGDWTLDTNVNQQIAGANTCNLPEALLAYLTLIEEIAPSWELNAKNIYGCRGIMSGARTAGRENYHTHFGEWPGHCWTAGAAWLIYPLYEHYLTTGDKIFLKEHTLPLMEKCVLFYEDFLSERDSNGKIMFIPSYSPEHMQGQMINAVQNIAAAKQVISNTIKAYEDLGIKEERITQLKAMLKDFPPYLINEENVFQEWAYPDYKENYNHRHMSHSYPVWPAHELNWENNPEEMKAMRIALEKRLPQDWSGHNFAIRAFCAARTKYPQLFWLNMNRLMRYDFIEKNLITRHNPGWCPNTDVLCGLPAMLTEALVYSKPGMIELLPAWSADFPKGEVKGIITRTQVTIDHIEWDLNKKEVYVTLKSRKNQWITLFARQGIKSISGDTKIKPSKFGKIAKEIYLPQDHSLQIIVNLNNPINNYPVNTPTLTAEEAERLFDAKEYKKK